MKARLTFLAVTLALLTLLLPSCSSDQSADAGDIISTIPSDASMVTVVNTKAILEKAGCKIDGEKITPSEEITKAVAKISNRQLKTIATSFVNGESGIDPSVNVIFRVGYYTYLTGMAADPAAFKKNIEKELGVTFSSTDGIDVGGNVAVAGNRFWVNIDQHAVDANEIRHFNSLDKTQSFMSNKYADKLCDISKDIEGWGNISGLLNTANLGFQQRATMQVALQTIFEDPSAITFSVMSSKGESEAQATVLDSKGNLAKYLLPTEKLDVSTIASLGGSADALAAVAVPHKLIEKLTKETESKGVSMLGIYVKALSGLDGTAAFAYSQNDAFKGVLSTNGSEMSDLSMVLSQSGANVVKDGKLVKITKGQLTGSGNVADMAKDFKGAIAGVTVSDIGNSGRKSGIRSGSFMLFTQGNGILFKITCRMADKDENAIMSMLNNL